jgi:predicted metalloendopeptidase
MHPYLHVHVCIYAYQKLAKSDRKLPGLAKYSVEQMFFINYGQIWCSKMTNANALNRILTGVHSPGEFRYKLFSIEKQIEKRRMNVGQ